VVPEQIGTIHFLPVALGFLFIITLELLYSLLKLLSRAISGNGHYVASVW